MSAEQIKLISVLLITVSPFWSLILTDIIKRVAKTGAQP